MNFGVALFRGCNSPTPSQVMQPQTVMLPPPGFLVLLTTWLPRGSPSLFHHHSQPSTPAMLNLLSYENKSFFHCSSIQSLHSLAHSYLNCLWWYKRKGFFVFIAHCGPWCFSVILTMLVEVVIFETSQWILGHYIAVLCFSICINNAK